MNRAQRRNANATKSTARKAGLTFLTVAGVVSGTVGLGSPAQAAVYTSTDCNDLMTDMYLMGSVGGTLTATFTGNCDISGAYDFQQETTIIGPTTGELTLRFMNSVTQGFWAFKNFTISNINFTRESGPGGFGTFIQGSNPSGMPYPSVTVSNVTFSDAEVSAAIYAEGNLTVSDSTFANLTSYSGGAAIKASNYDTEITNSTFVDNKSIGQVQCGTVNTFGSLMVANSTFDSNESDFYGGAICALGVDSKTIYNSTFVGNSAPTDAAVFFSEGGVGVIANSTFWNNGDADTYSIGLDANDTYFYGNILANDNPNTVKLIDPTYPNIDLGANLYTDTSFADTTTGEGSSKLVTPEELDLGTLSLNQTAPTNTGTTNTVAISSTSAAHDFYTATSPGINPTATGLISSLLPATDQRGVARPFGAGYDVGAFELGATPDSEALADTGLANQANYLGLIGLGLAAIVGGTAGQLRRRKKA